MDRIHFLFKVGSSGIHTLKIFIILCTAYVLLYACNNTKSEKGEGEEEGFTGGSPSTVVTGSNLTDVTTDCLHSEDETTVFQSLQCKIMVKNVVDDEVAAALLVDDFLAVTAVDGVEIAWGVPPELNFNCNRVRQSTELFCFRESEESLQDFSVLLSVTDLLEPTRSFVVTSTAVSSSINQETAPNAPSGLSAVAMSSTQIDLTYVDNSTNETGFSIERSLDEVSWSSVASVASGVVSFSNTSLSPSVQYYYRVRACNSAGCSTYSTSASATTDASGGSNHVLFVTSTTYDGNLGGLAGADLICSTRAAAASLTGTWKAILSTATVNALSRITISSEIKNTNDDVIAQDGTDFWDGSIDNPVGYDEFGNAQADGVWTGTYASGTGAGIYCVVWSSPAGAGSAYIGDSAVSDSNWMTASTDSCAALNRVYCINGQ